VARGEDAAFATGVVEGEGKSFSSVHQDEEALRYLTPSGRRRGRPFLMSEWSARAVLGGTNPNLPQKRGGGLRRDGC
jgi:hypothetical protein